MALSASAAQAGSFTVSSGGTQIATATSSSGLISSYAYTQAIPVPTTVGTGPGPTGFNYYQAPGGYTFTWDFTANAPITVTELGYYNSALTGQANAGGFGSHLVSLYDVTTDTTLASVTVDASSPTQGAFNYAAVTPVTLNTTDTYQVSGTMTSQYYLVDLNQSVAPAASQINYQFVTGNIFGSPSPDGTYSDFGPNFTFTTCTENVSGRNIIALSGDKCTAARGAYNPTTSSVALPVAYNGFGFYAHGGAINAPDAISITTTDPKGTGGSHAVWADGAGSQIAFQSSATLRPAGVGSYGLYATGGGFIDALGAVDIATTGANAYAVRATGTGSQIGLAGGFSLSTAGVNAAAVMADSGGVVSLGGTDVASTIATTGAFARVYYATGAGSLIAATNVDASFDFGGGGSGAFADQGAALVLNGGSIASIGNAVNNVAASNGASVSLTGVRLTLSGDGASGLWASNGGSIIGDGVTIEATGGIDEATSLRTGGASNDAFGPTTSGGVLKLTNSTITASGRSAYGVYTSDGGVTTLVGDAIATTGPDALGVGVGRAGRATISGGRIDVVGDDGLGLVASGIGAAAGPAGAITTQLDGDAGLALAVSGKQAIGVLAAAGGGLSLDHGSISASGAGAIGLAATGAGSVVSAGAVDVSATGAGAFAISALNGGGVALTGGSARVDGLDAAAVKVASGASATLNGVAVTASGAGSGGVTVDGAKSAFSGVGLTLLAQGGYDSAHAVRAYGLANSGGQVKLSNSTITATGDRAFGLYSAGGAVQAVGGKIATGGASSDAVYALSGANVNIARAGVSTTGDGSRALVLAGTGTSFTGSNLTIATSGAGAALGLDNAGGSATLVYSTIATQGDGAVGVATQGGQTTLGNSVIATSGAQADAVYAAGGAALTLSQTQLSTTGNGARGLDVQGTGARLTGDALTIATAGANAQGVYNAGGAILLSRTTVATTDDYGFGVHAASGGSTAFNGGAITTAGAGATGVLATDAGTSVNVAGASGAAATIKTSGSLAPGVLAQNGAAVSLIGVQASTTGAGAWGLAVVDQGSSLTATDVTVSTQGGVEPQSGRSADAIHNSATDVNGRGGTLTLTNVKASATGEEAVGLFTGIAGVTNASGGAVTTTGSKATAVLASSGASMTLTGTQISAAGAGSNGLFVTGGAKVTGTNLVIVTTGDTIGVGETFASAYGVRNSSTFGSAVGGTLTLTDSSVTTSGAGADGVFTGSGNTTRFLGGAIATSGAGAVGFFAGGDGTETIDKDAAGQGATITTSGAEAPGLFVTVAGTLAVNGATVTTSGAQSDAALAVGGSATIQGGAFTAKGERSAALAANGVDGQTGGGDLRIDGARLVSAGVGVAAGGGGGVSGSNLTIVSGGIGVYAGPLDDGGVSSRTGGAVELTASSIATSGAAAYGAFAGAGGFVSLSGGSITTSGAGAHGLYASGVGLKASQLSASGLTITTTGQGAYGALADNGSTLTLGSGTQITTSGAGAHGLYVLGATASLTGPVSIAVGAADATGVYVGSGGAVTGQGGLNVVSAGRGVVVESGTAAASFAVSGPVSLKTTGAGAALTLSGDNASFSSNGGGSIDAAGTAIAFLNGAGQSATLSNFDIKSGGDLVFADPSSSTLNFNSATADAGTGNLANVTNNSELTLNANASALTGAVATTSGSVSNLNLSNGSSWTITGSSRVTNLSLTQSSATFAPGDGFKTLTVTNFTGGGGLLTFNAALGGANPGADQLIIDGGKATGSTTIAIRTVGAGGQVSVPLVTTANGGSIAPGAFTLAGPVVVDGFVYSLQEQNGGEFLVSAPGVNQAQANGSLASLAQSRQSQAVTSRVLGSILTGATEQINCSSCSSGFASFGSFALGAHGRWTLSPSVSLLAGASYDNYTGRGVTVNNALLGAAALRYDPAGLGRYRPFVEAGLAAQPYANVTYRRSYDASTGGGVGVGNTLSRSVAAYGRVGYIWRLSHTDEAAAYTDLTRTWSWTGGYVESPTAGNPFGATVAPSLDTLNIWKIGGQYTHLFGEHIEANVSAGYARAFGSHFGASADITGFGVAAGQAPASFDWAELGARLSYRFSRNVIADGFVLGTVGAEPAGSQIHGGVALRMAF